jgi:hypothetical protein
MDRILVPDDPDNLIDTTWSSIIEAQALFEVLTKGQPRTLPSSSRHALRQRTCCLQDRPSRG